MDILKLSTEWAKDEILSSKFFILFGLLFLFGALGFWQMGKTELAKAFITPLLVCGTLLFIIGVGLLYSNTTRIHSFEKDHQVSTENFISAEIARADKTVGEFELIVFKVIPLIIVVCCFGIIFLHQPFWRAICIVTIAMMVVILLVDTHSYMRIKEYKGKLVLFEK